MKDDTKVDAGVFTTMYGADELREAQFRMTANTVYESFLRGKPKNQRAIKHALFMAAKWGDHIPLAEFLPKFEYKGARKFKTEVKA
jgi:hypothetical protein